MTRIVCYNYYEHRQLCFSQLYFLQSWIIIGDKYIHLLISGHIFVVLQDSPLCRGSVAFRACFCFCHVCLHCLGQCTIDDRPWSIVHCPRSSLHPLPLTQLLIHFLLHTFVFRSQFGGFLRSHKGTLQLRRKIRQGRFEFGDGVFEFL